MTVNPVNNRFYVCYSEQSAQQFLSRDDYEFCRFIWPDYEQPMTSQFGKPGQDASNRGILSEDAGSTMFATGEADFTVLTSDDTGKTWHLATTPDFLPTF